LEAVFLWVSSKRGSGKVGSDFRRFLGDFFRWISVEILVVSGSCDLARFIDLFLLIHG
jgi:hypothetical protein